MSFKKTTQRFSVGEKVYVHALRRNAIISDVRWNGLTWMLSFEGEDLRCGDDMVSRNLKEESK